MYYGVVLSFVEFNDNVEARQCSAIIINCGIVLSLNMIRLRLFSVIS